MDILAWILALSIIAGQLIKIPIGTYGGAILLDAIVVSLCFWGIVKLRFHLKKPPLFVLAAIIFILIALFSLVVTPLYLTPVEYFTSLSYNLRFSVYILLGWVIYSGAFPVLRKNITLILIISGLGLTIIGLLQFIFLPDLEFLTTWGWDPHYFRTASTFLDPNFAGAYFTLTLILLTSCLVTRSGYVLGSNTVTPRVYYLIFAIIYLSLLTTFSRGSYLAFLISFGTLSILKRSVKLMFITVLLFAVLIMGFTAYQKIVAQPRGVDRAQSAEFRFSTWQQGWQLFSSHPLLGVGFNAYRFALGQNNLGGEQFLKSHGASTNDSSLLYVAATTGIVGFASYLFFLSSLFKTSWKKILEKEIFGVVLIAGLLGLLSQSLFANTLFYPPLLLWLVFIAIL